MTDESSTLKHKTLGQVYTPNWIVAEILDAVGYSGMSILDKYILEPSSGDGVFLLVIVERFIAIGLENKLDVNEIKQRLEKYIYGVELDEVEHKKSIDQLNVLVQEKLKIKEELDWKVFNINTLDFYKNYVSFFDFVVGNPPYIRIHNLDLKTREILKSDFMFSSGTIDIYLCFFEMGLKMLKNEGLLGFITPNSYLHNSSYGLFRNYLKNQKIVKTLIDFKANKIFKGYSTYTAITILDKNQNENYFDYKELINSELKLINKVNFEELNKNDWSFTSPKEEDFLVNLARNKNAVIKDYFDVQYGFATLRDKIFIANVTAHDQNLVNFNNFLIEKNILKTVVKGSKFKGIVNENDKILFPYELENGRYEVIQESKLMNDFPNAYQYLLANRTELEARDRDKGATWYEFGRSQGVQTVHNEKIVLSTLVNDRIEFYRVPANVMVYSGLFIIKNKPDANWKIVEETLSSDDFYKYIRLTGKDFSGGYKSITSKQIKEFKIQIEVR